MKPRSFLLHAVLVLGALLALGPLLWMLSASFMADGQATSLPPEVLPSPATLDQYRTLFSRLSMGRYLANSIFVALLVTTVSLLVNSLAGYAFAKLRFRGRERLFGALLALLVIPAQITMLPLFLLLREMGLINTYLGVAIPGLASVFGIFLIRQYALSIPDELLDAARMDGAGEFRIYWSVVLPVLLPILVTLGIFTFMGTWNDFLWPLIVLSDDSRYTLPVALANLSGEHVQDIELMMAGAVVTVLPVMLVFLFLQRYYLRGIMLGSVKG
ncbi:MAG TPA: carbohydrate ABC transporter permease [Gemmatimonadales bacterium]|nr:carbohydrate ABC transporter permease [Gemmatimonadales bacterium]